MIPDDTGDLLLVIGLILFIIAVSWLLGDWILQ